MKNILSANHLRQVTLVEFLVKKNNTPQQDVIKLLNYNKNTFYRDVETINTYAAPIQIQLGQNVTLFIPMNYSIGYFYSCVLFDSVEFTIIETLFFNENYSINELSEKLFISSATLRRLIKKINTELSNAHFHIDTQTLKIRGDEEQICNFLIYFLAEKYAGKELPFRESETIFLRKLTQIIMKKNHIKLSYSDFERVFLWTMVSIIRIQHKISSPTTRKIPNYIDSSLLNDKSLLKLFKAVFKFDLTAQTLSHLFYIFLSGNYAISETHLDYLMAENESISTDVLQLNTLIQNLSRTFDIEVLNQKKLILSVYNVSTMLVGKPYILYNRDKEFVNNLTNYQPFFKQALDKELRTLASLKKWEPHNMYSLAYILLTHWEQLAIKLKEIGEPLSIGLFFDTDKEHMQYIRDELSLHHENRLEISIINDSTLSSFKYDATQFDLIITTIQGIFIPGTPVLCISMYLQLKDYAYIQEIYEIKYYGKKTSLSDRDW
ncbi:helix-turn-helix domain-containing protein [Carnobacterium maltaromaticum]|uniref:Helix-turn-helix domain-containing protein n=1 Tax=Carnobacterium maltaromaticum TaxID=2751 RepID=A0AAW9K3Y8_CARML|nr:helix-turn-helix domain-containing protein [Carnobacterium maltaromaticum]MDZ5759265.1 helix-turn-helix domain-containing protein [Carnobacterium maltaromaticum]